MASERKADGSRAAQRSGSPAPSRDKGMDGRGGVPPSPRKVVQGDLPSTDQARPSDSGDSGTEGAGMAMGSRGNLWLPQDGSDLSIYKKMLACGAIRPYQMPDGIEKLANHLMSMLEMAHASGRVRDAVKCIELLRMLASDNRQMALEIDKVDRLDAGKPTQITGAVAPEVADRIKRIVSTQRARILPANTEATNGIEGAADVAGLRTGPAGDRGQGAAQARPGDATHGGDRQAPQDAARERGEDPQDGVGQ